MVRIIIIYGGIPYFLTRYYNYITPDYGNPVFTVPNIPLKTMKQTNHIPRNKHYYSFIPYRVFEKLPIMFILRV